MQENDTVCMLTFLHVFNIYDIYLLMHAVEVRSCTIGSYTQAVRTNQIIRT